MKRSRSGRPGYGASYRDGGKQRCLTVGFCKDIHHRITGIVNEDEMLKKMRGMRSTLMDRLAEWLRVAAEGVSVTWRRAQPVISCADFTVRKGEISRPFELLSILGPAVFRIRLWKGWRSLHRDPELVVNVVLISLKSQVVVEIEDNAYVAHAPMAVYSLQSRNKIKSNKRRTQELLDMNNKKPLHDLRNHVLLNLRDQWY